MGGAKTTPTPKQKGSKKTSSTILNLTISRDMKHTKSMSLSTQDIQQSLELANAQAMNQNLQKDPRLNNNRFYELSNNNDDEQSGMDTDNEGEEGSDEEAESSASEETDKRSTTSTMKSQPAAKVSKQHMNGAPSKSGKTQQKNDRVQKPPQIIMSSVNIKYVSQKIASILNNNCYTFVPKKNGSVILNVHNIADFYKVKNLLSEEQLQFFTFTPKCDRPYTYILKNFPHYYEENDIIEAFKVFSNEIELLKVSKFKKSWLLQVTKLSNIKMLLNIKYLNQVRVYIEKFKQNSIVQCKRCQRYNHMASNCNMPFRCVKCGEGHGPGKCKIPSKEQNTEIFSITLNDGSIRQQVGQVLHCALCNRDGHTANYKKCEVYQKIKQKREEKHIKVQTFTPRVTHNIVNNNNLRNPNVSYAQIIQNQTHTNNNGNGMSFINDECQSLFGKSLTECLARTNNFLKDYNQNAPKEVKQEKLFNFFISICSNG